MCLCGLTNDIKVTLCKPVIQWIKVHYSEVNILYCRTLSGVIATVMCSTLSRQKIHSSAPEAELVFIHVNKYNKHLYRPHYLAAHHCHLLHTEVANSQAKPDLCNISVCTQVHSQIR